jgi:hypothetical protein
VSSRCRLAIGHSNAQCDNVNAAAFISTSEVGISAVLAGTRVGSPRPAGPDAAAFLPWMQLLFGWSAGDGAAQAQGVELPIGSHQPDDDSPVESATQDSRTGIDAATGRANRGVHQPGQQRPSQLAEALIRSMLADGIWSANASGGRTHRETDPNEGRPTGEAPELPGKNQVSIVLPNAFTSSQPLLIEKASQRPELVRRFNDITSKTVTKPHCTEEASEADREPDPPGETKQNALAEFLAAAFIGSPMLPSRFETLSVGLPGRPHKARQPGDTAQFRSSPAWTGVHQTPSSVDRAPRDPGLLTPPLMGSPVDKNLAFGARVMPKANDVPESMAPGSATATDREPKTSAMKEASRPSLMASTVHPPLKERFGDFKPATGSETALGSPFEGTNEPSTAAQAGNGVSHGTAHGSLPVPSLGPLSGAALLTQPEPVPAGQAQARYAPAVHSDPSRMETRAPTHDLSLRLLHTDTPVDVHVRQRAGAVHVAVRTPDEPLQTVLRRELPDLVQSLDRAGFLTETFTETQHRPSSGGEDHARQHLHNGNDPTFWESANRDGGRRERERLMEQWSKQIAE